MKSQMPMFGPGSRLGIVGGGQLGRMLAMEAQSMGCYVAVYEPGDQPPAASVAHEWVQASFDDQERLADFVSRRDVTTFEFENLDAAALEAAAQRGRVLPSPEVLAICQDRVREKEFFASNGFPCPRFARAATLEELRAAVAEVGIPCVVKTTRFGYDGKGQMMVRRAEIVDSAWEQLAKGAPLIVEELIEFEREISVIVGRSGTGEVATFPVAENEHRHHILDVSIVPARVGEKVLDEARQLACDLANRIGLHGLLAIELFHSDARGLLVNELAPRPHNSGHYSLDACVTSQFGQQLRAVCDMPLGETTLLSPVVMVNLLGELWGKGEPNWRPLLATRGARLHLYGKHEARTGRKMGHFTVRHPMPEEALRLARAIQQNLFASIEA